LAGVLTGVETKLGEFLAQGQARDAKPSGSFGLIALRQFDGLPQ
jgi:hypothetical protein